MAMRRLYQNFKYSDATFLHSVQLYDEQIILKFQINRTYSVANRTAQSCKFFVHHISRKALASLKIFCIPP
ncbi:hypothetical protein O3M35_008274 [Rhynocoris fuscipes]|uniref:Uncharacterized protein n=1 Tax=Rhynocoris fuscipes TaxID=488301 RepID=A0AAW1D700_9HEMI